MDHTAGDEIAADLIAAYPDDEATLSYIDQHSEGSAKWVESRTFPTLRAAVQAAVDDGGEHEPYTLMVHASGGDVPITIEQTAMLLSYVKRGGD